MGKINKNATDATKFTKKMLLLNLKYQIKLVGKRINNGHRYNKIHPKKKEKKNAILDAQIPNFVDNHFRV